PASVAGRIAFWQRANDRLGKLSNRIAPALQGKVRGELHARIPMVTPAEQRALQLANAEADAEFWTGVQDLHASKAADQKALVATVQRDRASGEGSAAEAAANATRAKERVERIGRGEDVQGGLGKPHTREDFERILRGAGFTDRDIQHCCDLAELSEL